MKLTLRAWYHALPLKKPYRLSFAVLEKFETLYIALEGDGRTGVGEVTPLPGYGTETIELAIAAVQEAAREFSAGKSIEELSLGLAHKYPFTASGLACAYETWVEGEAAAFDAPLASSIPLAALCPGNTPATIAAEARRLLDSGVTVLKLKAGRAPELEESLVRAVAKELPPGTTLPGTLRLDANQAYNPKDALELCRRLEDLGQIGLLEQPFNIEMWSECAQLTSATTFPIMLNESICEKEDIRRAQEVGAKWIKLKLCKHPGMAATAAMIAEANGRGFRLVFGNGVQTALGNHLENRVHLLTKLPTATEANGFAKVKEHPFTSRLNIVGGNVVDQGLSITVNGLATGRLVAEGHVSGVRQASLGATS